MTEYRSITSPDIWHDEANAVVEVCLLKQHGSMPAYPWRKSVGFQPQWQSALGALQGIMKTQRVKAADILFVCHRYDLDLKQENVGLIVWHLKNKYFEEENIQARLDELEKTHGNKQLDITKKVGRRSLLRKRSK